MLGSPCSPCCNQCSKYEPPLELSATPTAPTLPSWPGLYTRPSPGPAFNPDAGQPVGLGGGATLSLISETGFEATYAYSRSEFLRPDLAANDNVTYGLWALLNPTPPVTSVAVVSREFMVLVYLYPFNGITNNPPASDLQGACGFASFSYTESVSIRWNNGLVSNHSVQMVSLGRVFIGKSHANPSLAPAWTGTARRPAVGSDGVDRTQYQRWAYNTAANPLDLRQPVSRMEFQVQYHINKTSPETAYDDPQFGSGAFIIEQ